MMLLFFIGVMHTLKGQVIGRLESEYKLAVPEEDVEALSDYLITKLDGGQATFGAYEFNASYSEERFKDIYFDTPDKFLLDHNIGLRYRKRYIDGVLEKELLQLKSPTSLSDVVRSEDKYAVDNRSGKSNQKTRHPFLRYVRNKDRDKLDFQLNLLGVTSEQLEQSVTLTQVRRRLYLSDESSSIATITLDQVRHADFPYQHYTEMELELNEIRYTQEDERGRARMDSISAALKHEILNQFPNLYQDQTPKYNKLYDMIEGNPWSWIRYNWAKLGYGVVVLLGIYSVWSLNRNAESYG